MVEGGVGRRRGRGEIDLKIQILWFVGGLCEGSLRTG